MTATPSFWIDSAQLPRFPRLSRPLSADVVVIGGGITGLTTAYLLKRLGRTVVLLERDRLAGVDTGCTTAHLTCVTDLRLTDLEKSFGRDHARAVWDAGFAAIDRIERCIRDESISCDFEYVPGYLHARRDDGRTSEDAAADLAREAALASELGFDAEFVERVPFFDTPGVRFEHQARFHPRKYLAALARAIDGDGSHIFEESPADEVVDDPLTVKSDEGSIQCGHVVVATHNPIVGKAGWLGATLLQTKLSLYSSYVVAGRVARGAVPDALFWDTADPYRYVRIEPQRDFDLVIAGGEDHKTGQQTDTHEPYRRLEEAVRRWLPAIEITHRWSGQVIETADGLPLIGEMAPRQFAATGFAGNGMTFGTLAAMMAADAIEGRTNPWSGLLDIDRTRIRAGIWDYLKENKDYPYYLVRDRFAGAETKSLRAVRPGEGRIVDVDGKRVAAYRNDRGALTLLSPVCTHMGCHVGWNAAEHTWDCPCHGSRFQASGDVLSGPAESPLEPIDRAAT
ncbi:MAG TPA: FAD-dependent oxidoreductase [Vicinamibacterales bacterium]|nr:FAD-dependent oxidoreductase [Vicinamibacterales bacterium]